MIVRMVADGTAPEALLAEYPQLTPEDIREALRFAAANVDQRILQLAQGSEVVPAHGWPLTRSHLER